MIPVGRERDNAIEALIETHPCRKCRFNYQCCDEQRKDTEDCFVPKEWSTMTHAAMELWEDFLIEAQIPKTTTGVTVRINPTQKHWHVKDWISYKGDTVADAISGAWLKWKESTATPPQTDGKGV